MLAVLGVADDGLVAAMTPPTQEAPMTVPVTSALRPNPYFFFPALAAALALGSVAFVASLLSSLPPLPPPPYLHLSLGSVASSIHWQP